MPAETVDQPSQQRECVISAELIGGQVHQAAGVFGDELDAIVGPPFNPRVGAQADGDMQRLGPGVKEVQRPDVDGAACQINSCRRRC